MTLGNLNVNIQVVLDGNKRWVPDMTLEELVRWLEQNREGDKEIIDLVKQLVESKKDLERLENDFISKYHSMGRRLRKKLKAEKQFQPLIERLKKEGKI